MPTYNNNLIGRDREIFNQLTDNLDFDIEIQEAAQTIAIANNGYSLSIAMKQTAINGANKLNALERVTKGTSTQGGFVYRANKVK